MNAAVQETVHRFFHAVDRHDWTDVRACLDDEIAVDGVQVIPADEYVAARERGLDGVRLHHRCENHRVEVDGEHAECSCAALVLRTDERGRTFDTAARFTYGLTRSGNRWRIHRIARKVLWTRGAPLR